MFLLLVNRDVTAQKNEPNLHLHFKYLANGKEVVADSNYTNAFNEIYRITKLKFYISNIGPGGNKRANASQEVFLQDWTENKDLTIPVFAGRYSKLFFTIGVDSALNNSGAQSGSLDPLNGMFWTWNSGYIYFKMEGFSPASKADLQRIEYHIGGYLYPYSAARVVELALPQQIEIIEGEQLQLTINVNLDAFWNGIKQIKINENAVLMSPGALASNIADNFAGMFSIGTNDPSSQGKGTNE